MEITQHLKNTENALRDFIGYILQEEIGDGWEDKCGVSEDRVKKWGERKEEEKRRQKTGPIDDRLIYYADFYDLSTILKKNWDKFKPVFGHWKTMEVWLNELGKLRDPEAHRRELLPHQENLAMGISGEIRTSITKYRSKQETKEDYFPRIEYAADNLGNNWKVGELIPILTDTTLRPGDQIEYVVTASDPKGEEIRYNFSDEAVYNKEWTVENKVTISIKVEHIGESFMVQIRIRSGRKYHAHRDYDDFVSFIYTVLPPKD